MIYEIVIAGDLVLMSENKKNLRKKFLKWKTMFDSRGMKVGIAWTKVMVNGLKGETNKSKVDSCAKWGQRD